jgi:hypothetical protein
MFSFALSLWTDEEFIVGVPYLQRDLHVSGQIFEAKAPQSYL